MLELRIKKFLPLLKHSVMIEISLLVPYQDGGIYSGKENPGREVINERYVLFDSV
jgi:hypothetical protein